MLWHLLACHSLTTRPMMQFPVAFPTPFSLSGHSKKWSVQRIKRFSYGPPVWAPNLDANTCQVYTTMYKRGAHSTGPTRIKGAQGPIGTPLELNFPHPEDNHDATACHRKKYPQPLYKRQKLKGPTGLGDWNNPQTKDIQSLQRYTSSPSQTQHPNKNQTPQPQLSF